MVNNKKYEFTLPMGTKLKGANTYHVEEVLGQGGYGITYKVWAITKEGQIPVKVPFAIKEHFVNGRCHRAADGVTVEYSQEAADDVEESLIDFIKEGRLLNRICQTDDEAVRYIVPVNEVIEVNNTAYFVMQYLEGGSLRKMVLNSGSLPEEKALALMKPIVRAVDFIHRHKVLHMDIKPENIVMHHNLLTGQEEPVLIDFGVSLHFNKKGGLTSKHTSFGHTEGFSPIEQYGAMETFSPWIDVYALGATLYYLLTGKTPPKAFDLKPEDVENNLPSNVSKRTKAAIKHAMAKDYHVRTQSASSFLWELENDNELIGMETSDEQKEGADNNLTVKKKIIQTESKKSSPSAPPTPKRKWIWLLAVCVVFVTVYWRYKVTHENRVSSDLQEQVDTVPISTYTIEQDTLTHMHTPAKEDENESLTPSTNREKEKEPANTKETSRDKIIEEQFQKARGNENWVLMRELAKIGYKPACGALAIHYLSSSATSENHCRAYYWAKRSSLSDMKRVMDVLTKYGFLVEGTPVAPCDNIIY